ncbi:unnamed protein product [Adineta steineri]|uniref:Tr-type G domain-containing protein n=1 Tax=Adineta steineri TaxID=433720 RepID=A0A814KPZ1_9BILA|nr:unnamed protein product [Adineta steineri]
MAQRKNQINFIVIGNVDSGRSTTIDHFISKYNNVDNGSTKIDKNLLETLKIKYECGDPIDYSLWTFETMKNSITIIDTSGHHRFIKNMIMSSLRIDCTMLIVSAAIDEFEVGFSVNGLICEHIQLVCALGVEQIIIAVNKMDRTEPSFFEKRFDEIKIKISNYIEQIGYQPSTIVFVPISALYGDNLIDVSKNMPWFTGWKIEHNEQHIMGRTIWEALDAMILPNQFINKPLRLPLSEIYKIGGVGTVPMGRVATGILKPNMSINFAPSNLTSKVKSFETSGVFDGATPGDNVGFSVEGISVEQLQRGFVCSDLKNDPAGEVTSIIAYIVVLNHSIRIYQGYSSILCCHTACVPCEFVELFKKLHRRSGKITELMPKYIKSTEAAIVRIIPRSPICVERFADYPPLGRFFIRDTEQIVAVGIIKEIEKKESTIPDQTIQNKRRKQ